MIWYLRYSFSIFSTFGIFSARLRLYTAGTLSSAADAARAASCFFRMLSFSARYVGESGMSTAEHFVVILGQLLVRDLGVLSKSLQVVPVLLQSVTCLRHEGVVCPTTQLLLFQPRLSLSKLYHWHTISSSMLLIRVLESRTERSWSCTRRLRIISRTFFRRFSNSCCRFFYR